MTMSFYVLSKLNSFYEFHVLDSKVHNIKIGCAVSYMYI